MPEQRSSEVLPLPFSSGLNATILAAAVLAGGWLRFRALGDLDMTADEAPSWLSASAPNVGDVIHQGLEFNPGKLGVHDVILHFWMLAFGDSITSIRALSAFLGTLAIALVFLVSRELFAGEKDSADSLFVGERSAIAALSALVFALNVVAIRYSREGRMYELMLVATLIQLWFFLRAVRGGGLANYLGIALFSVLAAATSFVAILLFLAEAAAVLYALRPGVSRWPYSWNVMVSLASAVAIVACMTPWRLWIEKASFFAWIKPGYLTDYVRGFLGGALTSPIVFVTLALAVWGAIRGWQKYSEGVEFALLWMFVPILPLAVWLGPMMLMVVTIYSWTPLFAHRWALTSMVPLCIFVGLGIWELRASAARTAALALVVLLAGIRIHSYDPTSGDVEWGVQWRAATAAVLPELKAGRPVRVVPSYVKFALRYYSRNDHVNPALLSEDNRMTQMLILADTAESLSAEELPRLRRYYPLQIARLRGVTVLATPLAVNPTAASLPRTQ